ncbi:MAG: hypothetical protein VCA36_09945, partial [Opitutales bacterium]
SSGSVLIFVLALVVLLSALALRLMEETVREMEHVSQFHRRDDLRIHAYSAFEIAVGALAEWKEIKKTLYAPAQGWGDPIDYSEIDAPEGVSWEVQIEVENGKLSFDQLRKDPKLLASLFETMEDDENDPVGYDDSLQYADAFLDWEDPDENHRVEGAESPDYYEDLEPPLFAPNRQIQSFEEFRLIKGFGPDPEDPEEGGLFFDSIGNENGNFHNFKNAVSLRSSHQLNVNQASGFLRTFLCGENDYGLDELQNFFSGEGSYGGEEGQGRYFQSPNDPKLQALKARGIAFGVECKAFRLKITVSRGKSKFVLWALLEDLSGGSASQPTSSLSTQAQEAKKRFDALKYPFKILALRENENFID